MQKTKIKDICSVLSNFILDIFNNVLFKTTLIALIAVRITQEAQSLYATLASLLILPFFLFTARAGQLAKKYNHFGVTLSIRITELAITLSTCFVFYTQHSELLLLLPLIFGLFLIFIPPVRQALLPNTLEEKDINVENAYIRKTSIFSVLPAILMGVLLPINVSVLVLACFAVLNFLTLKGVDKTKEKIAYPSLKKTFKSMIASLKILRRYPMINRSVLGSTWFWSLGLLTLLQIYPLTQKIFNADSSVTAFLLVLYAVGVIVGAVFCSKLLKGLTHTTFVPISTIGLAVCFVLLFAVTFAYPTPTEQVSLLGFILNLRNLCFSGLFFVLAFCCGMYVIPLSALIRAKAPKKKLLTVFVANNIINALGIAFIALFFVGCRYSGFSITELYLLAGVASLIISIYNCAVLPAALLRSIAQTILEFFFRVKLTGLENFENAGKRVLIIANHTSLLDGLLIAAFMPEKITFVIKKEWENKWFAKFFGLMVDLYPLDLANPLSLRSLVDLIKKNKKVMIFPERRVSVTGALMKVYEGAGLVAEKSNANLLPIRINGAQYSKFSLIKDKVRTQPFPQISMNILPAKKFKINPNWTSRQKAHEVSNQLYDIMVEVLYESSKNDENIFTGLLNASKIHGKNHIIAEDITRNPMKYKTLILKSYVLGAAYNRYFAQEDKVGVLLPNVLANLVTFFALQAIDKTPAMLNFSAGIAQVLSCINTVQLKSVITSHKFIENAHLEALESALIDANINILYLEDLATKLTLKDKLTGILASITERKPKNDAEKTAAILFTSGSEGMPKAVFLSHKNLQSNRYQILSVIAVTSSDVAFNALPMFHSFGLGICTVLTTLSGVRTFYYPSPLHYRIVPELVYETNATILCGTDTFFAGYGAMAHPYDFYSLRYALVGAEKLKTSTAELWTRKFGIRILEGYGATEASPVISLNTPMYIRANSVGRLLPKIEPRLDDVPGITDGKRLFLRGDNVMQGYMFSENPGLLVPPEDGWHDTGDIVDIDDDGFVFIKGRAKRFAKIAGEMVSLTALEQTLSTLYPDSVQGIVAIPDEKKGEQLVLITTCKNPDAVAIKAHIKAAGQTELGSPAKFIIVKEPPVLGSGKFDYIKAQKMAEDEYC